MHSTPEKSAPKSAVHAPRTFADPERIVEPEDTAENEDAERTYRDGSLQNECWHVPEA